MSSIVRPTHLFAAVLRLTRNLNTPQAPALARVTVPLVFGLYSVWLGADSNWDLTNYHLYNAFAWLNGRLMTDLAPAGMQSYFNPMLDIPFYWMTTHLPSRFAGFLLGALHGLSFVLLLGIAQRVLPKLSDENRYRVPLLIALAGCLSPSFLSGLGNSMGDDTTALFSLAGLLLLVKHWDQLKNYSVKVLVLAVGSGTVVGLGVGLKLTTACYAVAMCLALLSYPDNAMVRVRLSFLFGIGVLIGWAITGGYWVLHMWQMFGNPLYPQFGRFFPNPLTRTALGDARWLPQGLFENLLWPFIFSAHPNRLGEVPLREIIWPIVYLLLWSGVAIAVFKRPRIGNYNALAPRARFVILYFAIGYFLWMKAFSVYRYIVSVEVLAPLVVLILLNSLLGERTGQRAASWLIAAATAIAVLPGVKSWGHAAWTDPLYAVDVPSIQAPKRSTAVIYSTTSAWAWLVPFFPRDVAFTGLDSSFPSTPAFDKRIRDMVVARGGEGYAVIDGYRNSRIDNVAKADKIASRLGLTLSNRGCAALQAAVTHLRLHATVEAASGGAYACHLAPRPDDIKPTAQYTRAIAERAVTAFSRVGLALEPDSCTQHQASIGADIFVYQWCRVRPE